MQIELGIDFPHEIVEKAENEIKQRSKKIEYYLSEYTIEILTKKIGENEYIVPPYQREYTWEEPRKWKFIESVLIGLPVPFIFFWEDPDSGKLEIVDGSQRLRTLQEFVSNELVLGELDKIPSAEGMRFLDFPESRRRKFLNRSIRGIVLSENADNEARFDLFERINTGSKVANKAEIRRGALNGKFIDLVIRLAKEPIFIELAPVSQKLVLQREREELITRFFAYGDGLDEYADEVSPFLFSYTKRMNLCFDKFPEKICDYEKRFNITMNFIKENFPDGFRRTKLGKSTPRARFEGISIGTYLAISENPNLTVDKLKITEFLESEKFRSEVRSDGANAISRLNGRIEIVRKMLLGLD